MTTTNPGYTGISCNGCSDVYEDTNGWSVSTPGVMWDSAQDNDWIDTDPDQHWCPSCQEEGKVPDDGGHKLKIEDGYTFCARCEEDWPCRVYEQIHKRDHWPAPQGSGGMATDVQMDEVEGR